MNELIGRRGGGGGSWRGGHGHWHGGRPRRFQFGAYGGGGYPYPYDEIEYETEEYGDGDAAYVSGASPGVSSLVDQEMRDTLTAIQPGAGGMTCDMGLGPDMVLHVSVCVDGRRYQADVDMSQTIAGVVDQVSAQFHAPGAAVEIGRHGPGGRRVQHGHHHHHRDQGMEAAEATSQQADEAIESAGMMVVGQLFDQHCRTVTAGWFDDITKGVSSVADAVQSTIRQFKGPLSVAAGAAAATAATGLGVPFVAPMAAGLAGQLVNAAAGDDHAAAAASRAVEAAKAAAINNPNIAAALDSAHKAVASLTGAYHVASVANQAAAGDPRATMQIRQLNSAANAGDAAARRGVQIAHEVTRAAMSGPAPRMAAYSPRTSYVPRRRVPRPTSASAANLAHATLSRLRGEAQSSVVDANAQHGDAVLGFVKGIDGSQVQAFGTSDEADDWLGALDPSDFLYAAYFDRGDPTWPTPLNEATGSAVQATDRDVVSGAFSLLPFLLGAATYGAGYAWWHHAHPHAHAHPTASGPAPSGPSPSGPTPVVTSGEVDGSRADAIVAAQELHRQAGATYVGYAKTRGGGRSDRGDGVVVTVEDTTMAQSFPTFDAMSAWFNRAAEEDYIYLACFDASSQAWPAPIGSIAAPAPEQGGIGSRASRASTRVRG